MQGPGSGSGIENSSVLESDSCLTDVFNRTPGPARHRVHENSVNERRRKPVAQRAASRRRMCVTTHASTTAANRRDARGETMEATAARTVCLLAGRRLRKNPGGRRAGQAEKLFEGRLLQLSKAYAPFVETTGF